MQARRQAAQKEETCLRISLDSKAKVKVGPFSRGGKARGAVAVKAADHDMGATATLVPFGILEIAQGKRELNQLWLGIGTSRETSDFIADALMKWWTQRRRQHPGVRRLHIELDNGPEIKSSRTQFMKRLVEFVDRTGLEIELVYLPPYHSKYNPIERCWGVLENHWSGTLLTSTKTVVDWAKGMTWRGVAPIVKLLEKTYESGVRLTRTAFRSIAERLERHPQLPKWSVVIKPGVG